MRLSRSRLALNVENWRFRFVLIKLMITILCLVKRIGIKISYVISLIGLIRFVIFGLMADISRKKMSKHQILSPYTYNNMPCKTKKQHYLLWSCVNYKAFALSIIRGSVLSSSLSIYSDLLDIVPKWLRIGHIVYKYNIANKKGRN